MPALRTTARTLTLLACLTLVLAACAKAAADVDAATKLRSAIVAADAPSPGSARYPPDVYRPSGYTVRSVTEDARVLTISGDAPGNSAELFAQALGEMPTHGWQVAHIEMPPATRRLVLEKSGYEVTLTFAPRGNATRLRMQLRRPAQGAHAGLH